MTAATITLDDLAEDFPALGQAMVRKMKRTATELVGYMPDVLRKQMMNVTQKMLAASSRFEGASDWKIVKLLHGMEEVLDSAATMKEARMDMALAKTPQRHATQNKGPQHTL